VASGPVFAAAWRYAWISVRQQLPNRLLRNSRLAKRATVKADAMKFALVLVAAVGGLVAVNPQTPAWWSAASQQFTAKPTSEAMGQEFCSRMRASGYRCIVKGRAIMLEFDTHVGLLIEPLKQSNFCLAISEIRRRNRIVFDPGWRLNIIDVDGERLLSCRLA
jgi:hypothetical protein